MDTTSTDVDDRQNGADAGPAGAPRAGRWARALAEIVTAPSSGPRRAKREFASSSAPPNAHDGFRRGELEAGKDGARDSANTPMARAGGWIPTVHFVTVTRHPSCSIASNSAKLIFRNGSARSTVPPGARFV